MPTYGFGALYGILQLYKCWTFCRMWTETQPLWFAEALSGRTIWTWPISATDLTGRLIDGSGTVNGTFYAGFFCNVSLLKEPCRGQGGGRRKFFCDEGRRREEERMRVTRTKVAAVREKFRFCLLLFVVLLFYSFLFAAAGQQKLGWLGSRSLGWHFDVKLCKKNMNNDLKMTSDLNSERFKLSTNI